VPAQVITAVALYGTKNGEFRGLLETVQALISERLRDGFRPYTLDQIHGTVVRLDGVADSQTGHILNLRYLEVMGVARAMDHARALEILGAHLTPPLGIRVGGYAPDTPATFASRGQHPHERMFSVQGNAFVLVGWPVSTVADGISPGPLDELRRAMSGANILHWYHESPADIDNDFHLVVGHHIGAPERQTREAVRAVRAYLADHPVQIAVGTDQLAIIGADSPTLAPAKFIGRLPADPADIVRLYR
jgi:hypothetical protein